MDDVLEGRYGPKEVGDKRMMCVRSILSESEGEMDKARFCDILACKLAECRGLVNREAKGDISVP